MTRRKGGRERKIGNRMLQLTKKNPSFSNSDHFTRKGKEREARNQVLRLTCPMSLIFWGLYTQIDHSDSSQGKADLDDRVVAGETEIVSEQNSRVVTMEPKSKKWNEGWEKPA